MRKIQKLIQKESGFLCKEDRTLVRNEMRVGKLVTITLQNPVIDVNYHINELIDRKSVIIPDNANAYSISEFNPSAQFLKDGKAYSCYALQFYNIL
ncbi:MAG: hypothetical protein AABW81_04065 [Nanoarchaeota archaeon]